MKIHPKMSHLLKKLAFAEVYSWGSNNQVTLLYPKIKVELHLFRSYKCEDDDLYLRFECDTQYNRISFYVIYGGENNICLLRCYMAMAASSQERVGGICL